MDRQGQPLSGAAQRRVVGDALREGEAQELAQGQGVREAPLQPPLRFDPFEEADEVHPEVDPRGHGLPPWDMRGLVIGRTQGFRVPVEARLAEQFVELLIEAVPRSRGDLIVRDPQRRLAILAATHRHNHAPLRWAHCIANPHPVRQQSTPRFNKSTGC